MKSTTMVVFFLAALTDCSEKPSAPPVTTSSASAPSAPATSSGEHGPGIDAPQGGLARGKVIFEGDRGDVPIDVEICQTDDQRRIGMMFRKSAADGTGMIFLMPQERVQQFWMRNTLIPLDMVFVGSDLSVVGVVADAEPLTLDGRDVGLPSRYVVELPGGYAARVGISVGSKMRAEGVPGIAAR